MSAQNTMDNSRTRRRGEPSRKVCGKCRKMLPIEEYDWWRGKVGKRKSLCTACSEVQRGSHFRGRPPRANEVLLTLRECHDCGAATTNHRCSSCLEKWQKKHGVSPTARYDSDNNMASTLYSVPRPSR